MKAATALPAVGWLRAYDRRWLSRDVIAGLSAGAVVVPQAMAYATIAKLPVQVGLYTCMVPMLVYVLIGGSRSMSVSTTSTVAVLTGSTLLAAGIAAGSAHPERQLATLTLLVGVVLVLARVLRIGVIIDNISEATLVGIKVGVGLTVAAGQIPKLLGIPGDPTAKNFFDDVRAIVDQRGDISVATLVFSAATIALLLLLRRYVPRVPGPLIATVGGILLVAVFSIDEHGVAVIARVPSGLPLPVAPATGNITALLPGAFAIAIMVFLESVSVARNVRRASEPAIDNDQELLAAGLSCVGGAFFRAMPSAGGFSQTAVNQASGAQTQVSELVTILLAIGSALFLGPVLSDLPQATLGAMVVVAVLGLIRPAEWVRFWRLDRIEFWLASLTAVTGLVFGMLPAVLIGVLATLFVVLVELDRVGFTELQPTLDDTDIRAADAHSHRVRGLLVLRFDGPLYTANVRSANRKAIAAVDATEGVQVLVLDTSTQAAVPVTVIDEMANFEQQLAARNVTLWIAALPPRALATARKTPRWHALDADGRVFPSALAAVRAFRSR